MWMKRRNRNGSHRIRDELCFLKKERMGKGIKLTDEEFCDILDMLWPEDDPEEAAKDIDESFEEDYRKFLADDDDLAEDGEEDE